MLLKQVTLRPMSEAPKDREIFAVFLNTDYHGCPIPGDIDWGNFHPIKWKDYGWIEGYRPHWGMRWSDDFRPAITCYGGWFDPRELAPVEQKVDEK
jgi:hypothetical protein